MASYDLTVNGKNYKVDADPKMPLLWAIRDLVNLTGTKYGCGIAQCGACTVHLNGTPVRSCSIPNSSELHTAVVCVPLPLQCADGSPLLASATLTL